MARVAIVVVTHNSASHIGPCLDALLPLDGVEIVVVDNASSDGTMAQVSARGITPIANRHNAGFAGAVNQGVRASEAPLILLLNPDAVLDGGPGALENEFHNPQTGAAGGMLTGADGNPQRGFMARNLPTSLALIFEVMGINTLWPGNPVNWHYRCLGLDPMAPATIEQPAGAFLMFPRNVWEKLGGFDENFWPVWFEDVDFCARLKQAGYGVRYNPAAVARHAGGHSVGSLSANEREQYWYGSLLKYAAKHYHSMTYRLVCGAVALGACCRGVTRWPRVGSEAVVVYGAICRLALGQMVTGRG